MVKVTSSLAFFSSLLNLIDDGRRRNRTVWRERVCGVYNIGHWTPSSWWSSQQPRDGSRSLIDVARLTAEQQRSGREDEDGNDGARRWPGLAWWRWRWRWRWVR